MGHLGCTREYEMPVRELQVGMALVVMTPTSGRQSRSALTFDPQGLGSWTPYQSTMVAQA